MSFGVIRPNFWELSPYCFCQDRHWVTVDDVSVVSIPVEGGEGLAEIAPVSGLSRDDTALLAALLTALALFLFLLFLLLFCLFPWGLCCKEGACCDGAACCGGGVGGKGKKRKDKLISSSDASSGSINLTALDMKIPRPWMDTKEEISDSKWQKLQGDTNVDKAGQEAFTFQDGEWFSTADLDSIYGGGRGSRRGKMRRRSMEETDSMAGVIARGYQKTDYRKSKSKSVDNLDSLMTYSPGQLREAGAYHRHADISHGYTSNDDVILTRCHGDGDAASVTEELKMTRTKTLNIPTSTRTRESESSQRHGLSDYPSVTAQLPYKETTNQIATLDGNQNTGSSVTWENWKRPSEDEVVSEYKAYRRVVKQTTTTTTEQ